MKKANSFHYYLSIVMLLIGMSSCEKQVTSPSSEQEKQKAIQEIRNIIGTDGAIKILDSNTNSQNNNQSESIGSVKSSIRKLSIDEFRNVYNALHRSKITYKYIVEDLSRHDSNLEARIVIDNVKKFDYDNVDIFTPILEDSSRPGKAGYYHAQFSPNSSLNYDLGGFYTLHLYYNTDFRGQIIGTPSVFYTGVGLYAWQQLNISTISFNRQTLVSNFVITGVGLYGIQIAGMTIGWNDVVNFHIKINMDESVDKQVTISQNE